MRAKHAAIDDHARGATFLADCKRRNDDMGAPAVLFQRAGMADQRHPFVFDRADTAEQVTTEDSAVATRRRELRTPRPGTAARRARSGKVRRSQVRGRRPDLYRARWQDEIGEDAADEEHQQSQEPTIGFRLECASTRRKTRKGDVLPGPYPHPAPMLHHASPKTLALT